MPEGRAPKVGEHFRFPDAAYAAPHRRDQGPRLLRRRAGRAHRRLQQGMRRRHDAGRPARLPAGMGQADFPVLSRLRAARNPAERAGHRRADRAGHRRALRHGLDAGGFGAVAARADRSHEAGLRRPVQVRGRPALDGSHARADAVGRLPGQPRQADPPGPRHAFRGGPSACRRHRLPDRRRRERHDDLVHPVQLHGLRFGRGGAGHRHQPAEPGRGFLDGSEVGQRGRGRQASVPHHHPGFPDARRQAGHELRRDGRRHAAARPPADRGAHDRLPPATASRPARRAGRSTAISRWTSRPTWPAPPSPA